MVTPKNTCDFFLFFTFLRKKTNVQKVLKFISSSKEIHSKPLLFALNSAVDCGFCCNCLELKCCDFDWIDNEMLHMRMQMVSVFARFSWIIWIEKKTCCGGRVLRAAQLIWRITYFIKPNRKQITTSLHYDSSELWYFSVLKML